MRDSRFDDLPHSGYCRECGRYVHSVFLEVGIGSYEFWGARGFDQQWGAFCPHCEGEVDGDAQSPCDVCRNYRRKTATCKKKVEWNLGECPFFEPLDE